jgi:photosystem II stability/assembly factor-like uncharacterized protein
MSSFSRALPFGFSLLAALVPFGSAAQSGWVSRGPDGVGQVSDLAFDDSYVYAATPNGVFRSADGGQNWMQAGLNGQNAWVILATGTGTILGAVYDPAGDSSSLSASRDRGATWSPVIGLPSVLACVVERWDRSRIAVEGRDASIWRSTDAGASWLRTGSTPTPSGGTLTSAADALYSVAYVQEEGGYRLFRTRDDGATWQAVIPPGNLVSVTTFAAGAEAIYVGGPGNFCRSTDSAATWTCSFFPNYPTNIVELAVTGTQPVPRLIARYFDQAYISDDGGATWTPLPDLGSFGYPNVVVPDPSGSLVVMGTSEGIVRSLDQGTTWTRAGAGLRSSYVQSLAMEPRNPSAFWIDVPSVNRPTDSLFRTSDAGISWSSVAAPATPIPPRTLVVDPSDSSRLYAGGSPLYRSDDAAASWTSLAPPNGSVEALSLDPASSGTVWAGSSAGLFRSDDRGQTWSGPEFAQEVYTLLFDGRNPGRAFAGSFYDIEPGFYGYPEGGSIFVSLNGGGSFNRHPHEFGSAVTAIATDPFDERRLYVGTLADGVSSSADYGATWPNPAPESKAFGRINSLVADPVRAGHLYAATARGVFRSTDYATSWQTFSSGLGQLEASSLVVTPDGNALRVATMGGGVFELDLEGGEPTLPCEPTAHRLCLIGGRYAVELSASRPGADDAHAAAAWPLSDRSGYFAFPFVTGDPSLPEVVVKMLGEGAFGAPGAPVFYATLTTLPWTLTVTDTVTGLSQTFHSDASSPLCGGATRAFASIEAGAERRETAPAISDEGLQLLGGRFSVTLQARLPSNGPTVAVRAIPVTDRFGYFSFPGVVGDSAFPEVVVKMIDFSAVTGKFWVFSAGLTTLDYTLTVRDIATDEQRVYDSTTPFCGLADTSAFPVATAPWDYVKSDGDAP